MADDPRRSLLGANRQTVDEVGPIYPDRSQTPTQKYLQAAFVVVVAASVLISLVISIYRGSVAGGMYLILGLALIGLVVLELCMVMFVRRGDLPAEKSWFLYFVGGCVILESIFTDIVLMD